VLRWADGRQVAISNSRRAVYGYDQRIEIHGSSGMVAAQNEQPVNIEIADAGGFARPPLHDFFMTRYVDAYANEINAFIKSLAHGSASVPVGQDGLNALLIADAALASAKSGRSVEIGD
jgi:myo-inositol 2-dehydrogenase/D-chiro-inositol 1-dehydrogenase